MKWMVFFNFKLLTINQFKMKKLILLFTTLFIFISCSKNEEAEFISPIIGTFEGTIDFGDGFVMNTFLIID